MFPGLTNRVRLSSRSHFQNSRHVELARAHRLEWSGWRFGHPGPPGTPALNEICPPNTREFALCRLSSLCEEEGPLEAVRGVSQSAGRAEPETWFCKPTRDR